MNWASFDQALRRAVRASQRQGARSTRVAVQPPATTAEVTRIEESIGARLPEGFRRALTEYSRAVDMFWFLDDGVAPPFKGIFSGSCQWSLDDLVDLERGRKLWCRDCFPEDSDSYDSVWHHTLPVMAVGNGDMVGLSEEGAAVYVSHDLSDRHGWRLGHDFLDYLSRAALLGFVGPEDWQLEPFLVDPTSGLQTDTVNAERWRQWLGLGA